MTRDRRPDDSGYSFVELLVVIVIIGILAAIAIPVFLHQRSSAIDASLKSDLRAVAGTIVSTRSDEGVAVDPADVRRESRTSPGNVVEVFVSGANVCLRARHDGVPRGGVWVQDDAGLHRAADGDCVGTATFSVP